MVTVSPTDQGNLRSIRDNVAAFIGGAGRTYDNRGIRVLDVAPQDHEGAKPYFPKSTVETLDIDPKSKATYVADLCQRNDAVIPSGRFDIVICTEVLEHTVQPFGAVDEIHRLLKVGGRVFVTAPFNFRIHGPLPDCWRFTEHGLRVLFKAFDVVDLAALDDPKRPLMPIHYTLTARKRGDAV